MFVEEQQPGAVHRRHQQRDGLPLAAGEQADLGGKAVFQAEFQRGEQLAVALAVRAPDAAHKAALFAALGGDGEVLGDLHIRRGALHGVLKDAAEELGALVFRHARHVHAVDLDGAIIRLPHAGDGVEQGGLARAVAADDGDKFAVSDLQIEAIERRLGVDGTGVERLLQVRDPKHLPHLHSPYPAAAGTCVW